MNGFNILTTSANFLVRYVNGKLHFWELKKNTSEKITSGKFVVISYQNYSKQKNILINYYELINERELQNDLVDNGLQKIFFSSSINKQTYIEKVNTLKREIQFGNIYEINFCVEFTSVCKNLDFIKVFKNLYEISKAPFCQLFKIDNELVICASPELFLKKEGNRLSTKPIKGTAKRNNNKIEDEILKQNLFNSIKDRTENVMAVDIARNDLSIIAKRKTVQVDKLYTIESFENVHQMVSTVTCELTENINFEEIINATFPMASMTGAPKISAMNLIDNTENFTRNFYSGTAGIIKENGDFELPVLIRSIFYNIESGEIKICVGGAITHLSSPEEEWEECLLKAKNMLKALNAELIA